MPAINPLTPLNPGAREPCDATEQEAWASRKNGALFVAVCLSLAVCVALATSIPLVISGRSEAGLSLVGSGITDAVGPDRAIETSGIEFAEVARERGLRHVWPRQPRPMRLPETFGCGCAAFDYDNDGLQDVLLVADPHPVLYHNTGGGYFEKVTAGSGLVSPQADGTSTAAGGKRARSSARSRARSVGWVDWTGVAVGDCDGDGWLDLLLTGFHRLALFKNRGGEKFVDVTAQAGLDVGNHGHWASSAGFMDLDGDSRLDLVILNYVEFGPDSQQYCELVPGVRSSCPPHVYAPEESEIWRNTGQGGYELVPASE
ncbi:MAG TPA: VCBS repeat-containing protein, partial [Pirellulales bacterium]|nr:VCBS repeat-containing protein [Pirellulales bacterium]